MSEQDLSRPHRFSPARDRSARSPGFPLRHRLLRALFRIAWLLLARWTPPAFGGWRRRLLCLFGARLHPSAMVYASARIWYPPNLVMAARSTLGPGVDCYCMASVTLGEGAVVSQGAHLCAGSHDIDDPAHPLVMRPIAIGPRAWVAAGAFIGPGVTLGAGAVAGARAVVRKDLAPLTVHIGNPARLLRHRRPAALLEDR